MNRLNTNVLHIFLIMSKAIRAEPFIFIFLASAETMFTICFDYAMLTLHLNNSRYFNSAAKIYRINHKTGFQNYSQIAVSNLGPKIELNAAHVIIEQAFGEKVHNKMTLAKKMLKSRVNVTYESADKVVHSIEVV